MDVTNKAPESAKYQIREERQVKLENKYYGTIEPKPGHRCYKYNFSTGQLFELEDADYFDRELSVLPKFKLYNKPAKFEDGTPFRIGNFDKKKVVKQPKPQFKKVRKIIIESCMYYFTALNSQNAIKHIEKLYGKR